MAPTLSPITGKPKARRGFAAMDEAKRREIARKGGASVLAANRSFSKDKGLAISAGSKGGLASKGGGRNRAKRRESDHIDE